MIFLSRVIIIPIIGGLYMSTIKIENLNKIYDNGFHAVHDFNLDIEDGDLLF